MPDASVKRKGWRLARTRRRCEQWQATTPRQHKAALRGKSKWYGGWVYSHLRSCGVTWKNTHGLCRARTTPASTERPSPFRQALQRHPAVPMVSRASGCVPQCAKRHAFQTVPRSLAAIQLRRPRAPRARVSWHRAVVLSSDDRAVFRAHAHLARAAVPTRH